MSRSSRIVVLVSSACLVGFLVEGCSSEDTATAPITAGDGGTQPGADAGAAAPRTVSFTVPASGGSVDVGTVSGSTLTFAFPASAAGKAIVLTAADPSSIGWTTADLQDVIKMEPDGTQFADPVSVRSATGGVMLATFPTKAEKAAPEWLALAPDGKSALLHHFSTLGVAGAGCTFSKQPGSPKCAQLIPGGGTGFDLSCDLPQLCSHVAVSCCVDPSSPADGCRFGHAGLNFLASRLDGDNAPSYCPGSDGGTVVDASVSDSTTADVTSADDAAADSSVDDAEIADTSMPDAENDSAANDAAASDAGSDAAVVDSGPSDASAADASSSDAGGTPNGNCSSGNVVMGDAGTGFCTATRIDGTATIIMDCNPNGCRCYRNNLNTPYGQFFSNGATECANQNLAIQQMWVNCGCPIN